MGKAKMLGFPMGGLPNNRRMDRHIKAWTPPKQKGQPQKADKGSKR